MKKFVLAFSLVAAFALPALAQAREVIFTTELQNYGGKGAYLALYLTDASGKYRETLWVSGKKTKYYKHLSSWAAGSGLNPSEYDGLSGASVTSGRTLKVTLNIDDALIDSGYEVRIDSAVEDMRDVKADVISPLTSAGSGKAVSGRGNVSSLTYDLQ